MKQRFLLLKLICAGVLQKCFQATYNVRMRMFGAQSEE